MNPLRRLRTLLRRPRETSPRRPPWNRQRPALPILAYAALKAVGWSADDYDRIFGGLDAGLRQKFTSASTADLSDAYAASTWVYAATTARAQAVSDVPLVALDASGQAAPAWNRLSSLFTSKMLWALEADLCLVGMSLMVKLVNAAGLVTELRRVNPKMFTVDSNERDGLLGFRVQSNEYPYLAPEQAVFVHLYDPNDDFGAVSPAEVAMVRAGSERAMMEYVLSWFANNGVPDALFMPPENPDLGADYENAASELALTLREMFKGAGNAGKTGVLPHRWEVWESQKSPDGVALPALADEIKEAILTAFGMAESLLTSGASNYAEAGADRLNFYQNTVRPRCKLVADELTAQVVRPHFGAAWRLEPDFSEVPAMQADKAERVGAVNQQVSGGYMTLAEAREETYLPADERFTDYVVIQGVPVHVSKLPELYKVLLPEGGASGLVGGFGLSGGFGNLSRGFMAVPLITGASGGEAAPLTLPPNGIAQIGSNTPSLRAALVDWQRAAAKGQIDAVPPGVPARVAFPLLDRLQEVDDIRRAFDPAFAAAKAGLPGIDLDRWWEEHAETENEAADRLEALWETMLGDIVETLERLPAHANAEAVTAALDRAFDRHDAAHYAAVEPLVLTLYRAGAALGSDQVDLKMEAAKALQTQTSLGLLWNLVNQLAVDWARENAGKRITRVTQFSRNEARRLVAERMAGGMTHEELIEELTRVQRYPDGNRGWEPVFGRRRAELIAQTEATFALDGGQEAAWRARGVRVATWYTANDERVCPICGALYKKVAHIGEPFAFGAEELAGLSQSQRRIVQAGIKGPPAHPGCRCTREPGADEEVE